jgi:hypothetical protein
MKNLYRIDLRRKRRFIFYSEARVGFNQLFGDPIADARVDWIVIETAEIEKLLAYVKKWQKKKKKEARPAE